MKSFCDQFNECKAEGMAGKGEVLKFKDHPELLPHPFSSAAKAISERLKSDPDYGLETICCLRFGGECNSANVECRKLRTPEN